MREPSTATTAASATDKQVAHPKERSQHRLQVAQCQQRTAASYPCTSLTLEMPPWHIGYRRRARRTVNTRSIGPSAGIARSHDNTVDLPRLRAIADFTHEPAVIRYRRTCWQRTPCRHRDCPKWHREHVLPDTPTTQQGFSQQVVTAHSLDTRWTRLEHAGAKWSFRSGQQDATFDSRAVDPPQGNFAGNRARQSGARSSNGQLRVHRHSARYAAWPVHVDLRQPMCTSPELPSFHSRRQRFLWQTPVYSSAREHSPGLSSWATKTLLAPRYSYQEAEVEAAKPECVKSTVGSSTDAGLHIGCRQHRIGHVVATNAVS